MDQVAQDAEAGRPVLDPVGAGRAEVLVVDEHLGARVAPHPGHQLAHVGRVVAGRDTPLGDREGLARELLIEPVQRLPVLVVGVEVGPGPVDPAAAGIEVPRPVLRLGRRAGRQRAPDHFDRRLRQPGEVALQWRHPGLAQSGVDLAPLAAAVDDHVDAAEGAPVPERAVGGIARHAGAVVGGVDVEAAVGLAQGADVGAHLLRPEELVEADQVVVAAAGGDPAWGDQLVPVLAVGGGDVQDRPRPRLLPAFDRAGELRSPGAEGLDQRRVLVQGAGELAEVARVAGVADAEEGLVAARHERCAGVRPAPPASRQSAASAQSTPVRPRLFPPVLIRASRGCWQTAAPGHAIRLASFASYGRVSRQGMEHWMATIDPTTVEGWAICR